jgi:hypothetical protein
MTSRGKISKTLIEVGYRTQALGNVRCRAASLVPGTKNDLSRAAVPAASLFKL